MASDSRSIPFDYFMAHARDLLMVTLNEQGPSGQPAKVLLRVVLKNARFMNYESIETWFARCAFAPRFSLTYGAVKAVPKGAIEMDFLELMARIQARVS